MNINENFSNKRKHLRKIKGCTYSITYVSPTICSSVSNLVPIQCLDSVPLPYGINMKNIYHEYSYILMKTEKMNEKMRKHQGGALPKLLISQLLNAL